jgi:hypothetical protein
MMSISRSKKLAGTVAVALLGVALLAAAALAVTSPDQTRESFMAKVEPICKKNTKSNEAILSGVRQKIKKGQLNVAAGQFTKAAGAFGGAVKQIKAVPQPVADAAKLGKWIGALEDETKLLGEIGKALKAGDKGKAQTLSVKLTHNGNVANNAVLGFDFDYCLIDSSRFS